MKFENIKLKKIDATVRYYPKATQWSTLNRKDHIIGIKFGGDAIHDMGYQTINLSDNTVYFLNQKDDYHVTKSLGGWSFSVHFTTYEDVETDSFCVPCGFNGEIINLLEKIEKGMGHFSENDLKTTTYFYQLIGEIQQRREKAYSPKDKRVLLAKEYMDLHFSEEHCLRDAIEISKLGERRFNDLFKNNFGVTPNRYLILCKTELSKTLLGTDLFSIGEIAERCGFADIYYFSKLFKKEVGIAPSRWNQNRK